ncbi:MAG: nucleotidyltransferase family protein [Candidatus Woesearchaeota archaeon]|nr:nucleotidyltransferase family protein [Nanoarchaeota archaeon]MBU1973792.1 nucleotidyltransferase family protein [Nanoarchaeota archaeon]
MNKEIKEIQRKVVPLLKKYGVVRAGIFGSYARGEQKKKSDLDLLIEVKKKSKFSLFDLVGLEMKLEQKLGKKVDLLTYNGINHRLKEMILSEEVKIL